MQARVLRNLAEEIDRLRDDADDGVHLARLQFLQCRRLIDIRLLDIDPRAAGKRSCRVRLAPVPAGPKLTFLPRRSSSD